MTKTAGLRRYNVLNGKGTIPKVAAERKAHLEYDAYNKTQKIDSDFEKELKKINGEVKKDGKW